MVILIKESGQDIIKNPTYSKELMEKLPPIEKVYEAWTALADGRVVMHEGYADVASSDDARHYVVRFAGDLYSSDDNATYWRGYAGYPVIAVLMLQGRLPLDMEEANKWAGVNWKEINTRYRNNYARAVDEVGVARNIDLPVAREKAEAVMHAIENLPIVIKRKI